MKVKNLYILLFILVTSNLSAKDTVGKTADSYEVTPNGQFHYEMPISVASGTGGMSPQLSIVYDSSKGDGLFGRSFDLSGISLISRVPRNLYRDGKADIIHFDESDRFMLDGARLTIVNETAEYREYRTENNSFSKIIAEGNKANPSKFTVYTKDGLTREYINAKNLSGRNSNNLFWLETKVTDTKGNYYRISYNSDCENNEFLPERITYTANDKAGLSPYASILITYKTCCSPCAFISGQKVKKSHVINRIDCKYGEQLVRRYDIDYTIANNEHLVRSIKESTANDRKRPTSFSWNNNEWNGTTNLGATTYTNATLATAVTGDFNGDGKTDMLVRPDYSDRLDFQILLSDGKSFTKAYEGNFLTPEEEHKRRYITSVVSGDFNGDGYDDIVVERGSHPFYMIDLYLSDVDDAGNYSLKYEKGIVPALESKHSIYATDINCDGAADLIVRGGYASSDYCMLVSESSENGITPLVRQSEIEFISQEDIWDRPCLVDFDGDGTVEILNMHDNNTGNLYTIDHNGKLVKSNGFDFGTSYYCMGDFNADGKTDVITMGTTSKPDTGWEMNFSTGITGENEKSFVSEAITSLFNPKNKQIFVADINGDGFDDLYVVGEKTNKNQTCPVNIYINDRTGKNFSHYTGSNTVGTDKANFRIADFNGDGKADFICYPNSKGSSVPISLHVSTNTGDNALTSVTDGLGNHTNIKYAKLTDGQVFRCGTLKSYPFVSAICPWPVVKEMSVSDGIGGMSTTGYSYSNLITHKRGRGILCFEEMSANDYNTGIITTKGYEILKETATPVLKYSKTTLDGKILNDAFYKNAISYQYNDGKSEVAYTYYPQCVEEKSYEYNSGQLVSHKLSIFEQDNFGNTTKSTVISGRKSVATENVYYNNEDRWILGRLTKAAVTKSENGESQTLTSEFKYDSDSGLLIEEAFEPEDLHGYRKQYAYDVFGNITSDVTIPNDRSYEPRGSESEYDRNGRFITKRRNALSFLSSSETDEALGVEKKTVDANGLATSYEHDSFGNVTAINSPLSNTSITSDWSNGNAHAPQNAVYFTRTDKAGSPFAMEFFDSLGRTIRKVTENIEGKTVYADAVYNRKGQIISKSEPYFAGDVPLWTEYEYDNAGRTIKEKKPDGATATMSYNGLTTSVTDANGNTSSKTYDMDGNLAVSTDATGYTVTYKYDASDRCIQITGPRTTTTIEYDKFGNRTKLSDPDLGTIEYTYTPYGELASQTDSKGTAEYVYDLIGRITDEKRKDFTYSYTYDAEWKGALSGAACSNGIARELSYDSYGRVVTENESIFGNTYTTRRTYDNFSRLSTLEYPSGFKVRNNYAPTGYLESVSSADNTKNYWKAVSSNAAGQPLSESLGNGMGIDMAYDTAGRTVSIQVPGILARSFSYDSNGNLNGRSDNIRNLTETFSYDSLDRLTAASDNRGHVTDIRYDGAGNITYKTGLGSVFYTDGTNRISSVKGEKYTLPVFDDIKYTSFNKISSLRQNISENPLRYNTLSIDYGVDKEKKVEFTGSFMGGCGQNFEYHYKNAKTRIYVNDFFTEETAGNSTKSLNYIFAGGKAVAIHEIAGNGEVHDTYLHHDNLGSVIAYSDGSGNLTEELSYDAWGRRRDPNTLDYYTLSNDSISEYNTGFTGHDHIDMFSLVNMEGRMYDPLVGRFMSPDPIVQMPEYTQSLNRYAYCINNPLSLTDPTGYSWIGDTFSAIVGIAVGLETGGLASGVYGAVIGGMAGGASSALVNSIINGANLMQTAKNTFTGGFWGGVSSFANFEIGNLENVYMKIAAHSVSEGAMEGIRGGHFEHGFFTGMASAAGGSLLNGGICDRLSAAERIAVNAALGGIVSELGGGKFASGAMTAAYVMMFNELKHVGPTYRQIEKIYNAEIESRRDLSPKEFYQSLGGEIAQKAKNGNWENACAARLSYAMNKSGLKIPCIKGITLKDKFGKNYFTLASDMIKYFNKIWGNGIVCNNKNIRLNNGITGQTGFTNASGHVDVVYNGKAAGGEHGAVYYYNEGAHTLIWKYGGFRK